MPVQKIDPYAKYGGSIAAPPPPKPDDEEDIEQPIASVRTAANSNVGDSFQMDGQNVYVSGVDSKGRKTLSPGKPPATPSDPYAKYGGSVAASAPATPAPTPSTPAPMTRPQADSYLENLATGGQGTWQPPKTPKFADTALVDPESPVFGEPIKSAIHPDTRGGRNLVPVQDVAATRQQMAYEAAHPDVMALVQHSQAMDTSLPLAQRLAARQGLQARTRTEFGQAVSNVNDQYLDFVGNKGADAGESFVNFLGKNFQDNGQATPGEVGAARSIGKNVLRTVADPANSAAVLATGGIGGKVGQVALSSLFAAGAAKGSYDSAGQLGAIWDRPDISAQQKAEMASDLVLNTAMAGMAGAHALKVPFMEGSDPLLSSIPQEYRDAVAQKVNSTLSKSKGILYNAASTAGDLMADIGNSDRENLPTTSVITLRKALPKVPVAAAQTALPLVKAAADNAGYSKVAAEDLLNSPPDQNTGAVTSGLIGQAKSEVIAQAGKVAGPDRTLADLTPEEAKPFIQKLDALDELHDHIQAAQDEETAELQKAAERGKIPATKAASLMRMGWGAGKIATTTAAGPALGRLTRVLMNAYAIPSGFNDLVTGVKGVLGAGGKLSPTLDDTLNAALGKVNSAPAESGLTPDQDAVSRSIFTPYAGDTTVPHDSLIFPPETPHGDAIVRPDIPDPRFNLSTSSTAQPLPRRPGQTPARTIGQPPNASNTNGILSRVGQMRLDEVEPEIIPPQGPGLMSRVRGMLGTSPIPLPAQSDSALEPTIKARNLEATAADPQAQWNDIRGFLQRNPDASPQQITQAVNAAIDKNGMIPSSQLPDMGDTGVQTSTNLGKKLTPRRVGQPPRMDVVATATDLTPDRYASFPRQMSGEAAAAHWLAGQTLPTLQAIAQRRGISFNPGGDLNGSMISKIVDSMSDRELQELSDASLERSRFPRQPEGAQQRTVGQPPAQPETSARAVGTPPGQERRQNLDYRAQIAAMTPEQQAKAIFFSDKTGLPNYRAFAQSADLLGETHNVVGYADVDNFKMANTKLGHVAVDTKILPMIGDLFKQAAQDEPGVYPFHRSGDEFLFRADDPAAITRVVNKVNEMLKDAEFTVQQPDGTIVTHKGVGLSHGTGDNEPSAEASSDINKSARKAAAAGTSTSSADAGPAAPPLAARDTAGQQTPTDQRGGKDLLSGPPNGGFGLTGNQPQGRGPGLMANATVPAASLEPGQAGTVKTSDLKVDPARFQYKGNVDSESGVTNALKDQKRFDKNFGGVLLTWKDPANGETFVINGHHRLELANRSGEPSVLVRAIDARDANEAQAIGALTNISEGRGTAVDAARFMKNSGMGAEELERRGLPMSESKLQDGLALSKLDRSILDKVESGKITEGRGIAIGQATDDPAQQEAILKLVDKQESKGRRISNDTVAELARFVKNSGNRTVEQGGLFGANQEIHSLALEKADVSAYVKGQIAKEKRTFSAVASQGRAEALGRVEGQSIKAGENAKIAEQAAQALEAYNKLSSTRGPVDDILETAAKEMAGGYYKPEAVRAKAYDRIREELQKAIGSGQEPPAQDRRP